MPRYFMQTATVLIFCCALFLIISAAPPASATVGDSLKTIALTFQASAAYDRGDYKLARDLLQNAVDLSIKDMGPEHEDTLNLQNLLAATYLASKEHQKALELLQPLLEMMRRVLGPEHLRTLSAQNNLAVAYSNLEEHQKALELLWQIVEIRQRVLGPEHLSTLRAQNHLAHTFRDLGALQNALELQQPLVETMRRVLGPEHPETLNAQESLAFTYVYLGDGLKALELKRQTLEARRRVSGLEHPDTLMTQNNLTTMYINLGENSKAAELEQQVVDISRRVLGPEHPDTLGYQHNLAIMYINLEEYPKALELLRHVLEGRRRVLGPEHSDSLATQSLLATTYSESGEHQKALELQQQVVDIRWRVQGPEHSSTFRAQKNLADIYSNLGEYQKALDLSFQDFIVTTQRYGLYHTPRITLGMAKAFKGGLKLETAIFYARLAVEAAQRKRQSQKTLERELQVSYLASVEDSYQLLAVWLIEAGRPEEALAVLRLLKEDEISEMSRMEAPGMGDASADPLQSRLTELGAALTEANVVWKALEIQPDTPGAEKNKAKTRLAEARQAFQEYMDELPGLLAQPRTSPYQGAAHRNLEELQALTVSHGPGAVIIHTLSAKEALYLFLTTPDGLVLRQSPVGREVLEKKVAALQPLLRSPGLDPRPLAKEIYDLVLEPLAKDLAGATTLMFSVDGALRYIPMAALYDGQKWLAEEYAVVMFTEAARDNLKPQVNLAVQAAALGLTEAKEGLSALPAVRAEVNDVVKVKDGTTGVLPGVIFLNDQFNYNSLSASLQDGRQVLHLASHFVFRPAVPNQSYLLLGDGRTLTLSDINQDQNLPFSQVDLLTLSACDTASGLVRGNGREVEGLAALAQRRGAATVLATLWPIADESTGWLMGDFYRLRYEKKQTKAEALRQAQLDLMQGRILASGQAKTRGKVTVKTPVSPMVKEDQAAATQPWTGATYAHPYFWAPFILMGNWK